VLLLTSITEPLEVGEVSQIGRLRCVNKPVLPLELRYNLLRSSQSDAEAAASPEPTEVEQSSGLRILIAEDNPVNRSVLLNMLRSEGFDADVAEDGPSALKALESRTYDLLLMDCQMPGLDGDQVTRELRSRPDRYSQPTIVVAVTADATEQHRAQCLEAGMDDFIAKPVRLEKLRAGLARWSAVARRGADAADSGRDAWDIRNHLIERTGQNDESFLNSYIGLFIEDTEQRLASLAAAVDDGDPMRIRREGHALKGACLEFGAERMARYCEDLSAAASGHNLSEASVVARKLAQEFDRLRPVFESAANSVNQ
jgi:CheY-like chemotaxis protein